MADLEHPQDPNKIDINLSLLSGQSGIAFSKFITELEAIRKGLQAATELANPAAAARTHADFYQKGYSAKGSRTIGQPSKSERISSESELSSMPTDAEFRQKLGDESASRPGGVRGRFNDFTRNYWERKPFDPHGYAGYTPNDEEEEAAQGGAGSGGASRPPGPGEGGSGHGGQGGQYGKGDWRRYIDSNVANAPLKIPRAGQFTSEDVLDFFGDLQARRALSKDQESPGSGDTWGNSAMWTYRAAHSLAPKAALGKQYWDRYVGISPSSMEGLGYQQGIGGGGGGDWTIPGTNIGMRTPFSGAAGQGTKIWWDLQKRRAGAGYTGGQAQKNFEQLTQRGYYFDQGKYGPMADSLQNLTQFNPEIGQNDQTADILDQTQRFGGMSLKGFVDTMKQVPEAARGARVSISQFVSDLNDWGHLNREQGGTFAGGVKSGIGFSSITGLPPSVGSALAKNQMVQGFGVQKYGLAPWQQGLLSPGQRASSTLDAVNTAYQAMGPQAGISQGKDTLGFNRNISGRDVQLANLHQLFPEISPEALKKMTDPKYVRETKARATLDTAMLDWKGDVDRNKKVLAGHGNKKHADRLDELEREREKHHGHLPYPQQVEYDRLKKDLTAHPGLYGHGQEEAARQALKHDYGKGMNKQIESQLKAAGFSKKERHDVMSEHNARKRYEKYQKIESKKSRNAMENDPNVPKVWIGLKKHAAQALHISADKAASNKADYGAGGGSATVNPYGSGMSISPFSSTQTGDGGG